MKVIIPLHISFWLWYYSILWLLLLWFSIRVCTYIALHIVLKPGACAPGSWNCFGSHVGMCVCVSVCVSAPRALITSGVIWCDIGRLRLVKQVSQLFPAFNYFIRHLPSIKWMGVSILTQHDVNACQRKLRWHGTSYKRTTRKTERFIHKSKWLNA